MPAELFPDELTQDQAQKLAIAAGTVFQPRAPVSTREFFAGRWEHLTTVADAVFQKGLHIVIFGERGVGKTSLSNVIAPLIEVMEESMTGKYAEPYLVVKINTHHGDTFAKTWARALDEVYWDEDRPLLGLRPDSITERVTLREKLRVGDSPSIDEVRRTLTVLKRSVFTFDEFDRGDASLRTAFTDLVKSLSDYQVDSTIVMVGVSETIDGLIRDHASVVRSIVQIQLPRMNERELREILTKASTTLEITINEDAADLIVRLSQGLPHYTHLIGLHATRCAADRRSRRISIEDVYRSFDKAVNQAVQSIRERYLRAIHSARKDALYAKVLLGCASASSVAEDALGYFHPSDVVEPLATILARSNVSIATFQKHLNDLCEQKRGAVLQRAGTPRAYKYRFNDPLLPPFIFMSAFADKSLDLGKLKTITTAASG